MAEKIIEKGLELARFTINGKGCYTSQEAFAKAMEFKLLYGREANIEIIASSLSGLAPP